MMAAIEELSILFGPSQHIDLVVAVPTQDMSSDHSVGVTKCFTRI